MVGSIFYALEGVLYNESALSIYYAKSVIGLHYSSAFIKVANLEIFGCDDAVPIGIYISAASLFMVKLIVVAMV